MTPPVRWAIVSCCFLCHGAPAQDVGGAIGDPTLDSLLTIRISTVSKVWETAGEAPASTTIVRSEDLRRYGYRTLDDVLNSVRGFYVSNDRNYVYLGVRGFSRPTDFNNRVLLLVNGHTINEAFYGSSPFGTDFALNFDAIDRIEIVRGPGSALYGSGAMFAIVNVLTKDGGSIQGLRLAGEAGAFGNRGASLTCGGKTGDGVDGFLSAQWVHTSGGDLYYPEYDTDSTNHGIVRGSDWDRRYSVFSSLTYRSFDIQAMLTSREKAIPTGAYGVVFGDPHAGTLDQFRFVQARLSAELDPAREIMVRSYFDSYHYQGTYPYEFLQYDGTTSNRIGGEMQFRWDLTSSNRLLSGIEYSRTLEASYRYWRDDSTFFQGDYPSSVLALYVQDQHQLTQNLSFILGLRRDTYSNRGNSLVPRAAVVFHPSSSGTLKLMYGRAFRAPNEYELNYEDPYGGFKANHGLTSEKISTLECEFSQRLTDQLYGVASLYTYTMQDLIDQMIDPVDSLLQFQNSRRVRATGLECELTARLHAGLNGYANYTYEHARYVDGDAALTNVPVHMVKLGLESQFLEVLRAALEMQYQSSRMTVRGSSTLPFFVANLNIAAASSATGDTWPGQVHFSLLVRNLFNAAYSTPGGFEHLQTAIAQDGRSYLFRLEWAL
jgi:outer membrane receptor for ferrienterochelin and colicins